MPGLQELTMIIAAKDQASAVLDKVRGSSDKLNLSWGGLAKTVALAGAAMVGAAVGFGVAVQKLGERANLITDVSSAFRGLAGSVGESMDSLLAKTRAATDGMISDFDLMTNANMLLRLNVAKTGDEVAELMGVASKLSESMGQEYTHSAQQFAEALVTGRIQGLKAFGIDAMAVKNQVEAMGLSVEDAAQQGKLLAVVMEEARWVLARTGKDTQTLGDAIDRLGATWQNVKDWVAMAAGPLANDIANTLADTLYKFGPAIKTIFTGFFEMMRAMGAVAKETVKVIAKAMGIDMDTLSEDAETWGENVILQFAQGMANAFVWVVRVLNQLGSLIAGWLAPGSPPKILPKIDEWGRQAIQEYLKGMGEGVNYDDAALALKGIERFFEKQMRPLQERLSAIGHERSDITDAMELAQLESRAAGPDQAGRDPRQVRLAQLRMEELRLGMKLRDVEDERGKAMTGANDILFGLERQVDLTEKLLKATEGLASIKAPEWLSADAAREFWQELPGVELSGEFQTKMATIFDPLKQALAGLVGTWGGVFGSGGTTPPWVAGMEQGATGMGGAPGGKGALATIIDAGLAAVGTVLDNWWATQGPKWEAAMTEWVLTVPGKIWAAFLVKQNIVQWESFNLSSAWWGRLYLSALEWGPKLLDVLKAPFEEAYRQIVIQLNGIIVAWNSVMGVVGGPQIGLLSVPDSPYKKGGDMMETINNFNLTIHSNAQTEQVAADFAMMGAFA